MSVTEVRDILEPLLPQNCDPPKWLSDSVLHHLNAPCCTLSLPQLWLIILTPYRSQPHNIFFCKSHQPLHLSSPLSTTHTNSANSLSVCVFCCVKRSVVAEHMPGQRRPLQPSVCVKWWLLVSAVTRSLCLAGEEWQTAGWTGRTSFCPVIPEKKRENEK